MNQVKKFGTILLAELPILLLLLPKSKTGAAAALAVFLLFPLILFRRPMRNTSSISFEKMLIILFSGILCGIFFYTRWGNTARFTGISQKISDLPPKQICAVISAVLSFCFCLSLRYFLRFFPHPAFSPERQNIWDAAYIFLLSALTITLLSKNSAFYPFNDWVDPNTMFTVGKGMLRGKVPYRDLYEQKGPLLLALHALAALISFDTLRGVWVIEIIACFFTLWFLYKILMQKLGRLSLALLPILALILYASRAFVAGDSAEEMSLPFLTYGLYTGLKAITQKRLPTRREGFFTGLTSGCILWIKFSHLGFYAGWFIFFLIRALRKNEISGLFRLLLSILCGVCTAAVPIFLYFGLNHAIGNFTECYFLNNIRYYPAFGSATGPLRYLINLKNGFHRFTEANPAMLICTSAGLLWCFLRQEKQTAAFLLLMFLTGFVLMFFSGVSFPYYVFIYGCFAVYGVMWLAEIPQFAMMKLSLSSLLSFFICALGCLLLSENIYVLEYQTADFPQFKVKKTIEDSCIEDPSILHYGLLDAGFNLPTELVPDQRFWCSFNLLLPEMNEAQDRYIEEGVTDFVITCHEPLYNAENYQLLGTYPGDFARDRNSSLFFLYQRIDSSIF